MAPDRFQWFLGVPGGWTDRADEIAQLNRIEHSGFVPAGKPWLSGGRVKLHHSLSVHPGCKCGMGGQASVWSVIFRHLEILCALCYALKEAAPRSRLILAFIALLYQQ